VLAAAALAGVVSAATVLPGVLRPDPYARPVGAWVYGYDVQGSTGLRVFNRFLTPTTDTVRLIDEDPDRGVVDRRTCDIAATSDERPVEAPEGRSTHVGTFPARFLPSDDRRGPALWWRTGPRLAFVASCAADTSDTDLLSVAALVQPAELAVRLPLDLTGLPEGEEVRGIYDIDGQLAVLVLPPGATEDSTLGIYVSVGTLFGGSDGGGRRTGKAVQIGDRNARLEQDDDTDTICWDLGGQQACVVGFAGEDLRPAARADRLDRLVAVARQVKLAPDPRDEATWFDARDAVPG
jgi:hypothetical protein